MDYEQLQIEHKQAESATHAAAAEAMRLKAGVGCVMQSMAALRKSLADASADCAIKLAQLAAAGEELHVIETVAESAEEECYGLHVRCAALKEATVREGTHDEGGSPRIVAYIEASLGWCCCSRRLLIQISQEALHSLMV